uniref:hypothetical protein n=1 Tax=Roseomonas chloroacetimidivorans TaxID=1766656 RepID=UPI003C72CC53
ALLAPDQPLAEQHGRYQEVATEPERQLQKVAQEIVQEPTPLRSLDANRGGADEARDSEP